MKWCQWRLEAPEGGRWLILGSVLVAGAVEPARAATLWWMILYHLDWVFSHTSQPKKRSVLKIAINRKRIFRPSQRVNFPNREHSVEIISSFFVFASDIYSKFLVEWNEKWVSSNTQVEWGIYDDIFWLKFVLLAPISKTTIFWPGCRLLRLFRLFLKLNLFVQDVFLNKYCSEMFKKCKYAF